MRIRFTLAAALMAVVGLVAVRLGMATSSGVEAGQRVPLGEHELVIPRKYLLEKGIEGWIRLVPGLDDGSREILVRFPVDEIRAHVATYETSDGDFDEDVIARLVALTASELQNQLDPKRFRDLWYRTGDYADAVVEQDRERRLLKVFRRVEYPQSWAVVSVLSEDGKALPDSILDFWVAHCLDGPSSETPSGRHVTCMSYATRGDLMVEFNISAHNLGVADAVRHYILDAVKEWERSNDN